jgi:protein involved in sex pheromone biosynthesis
MKKIAFYLFVISLAACQPKTGSEKHAKGEKDTEETEEIIQPATVDSAQYFSKVNEIINGDTTGLWPVKNQPLPLNGAICHLNEL